MKTLNKIVLITSVLVLTLQSCEIEPIGTMNVNTAVLDEELQDLVSRVPMDEGENAIQCIEFNYPFALFVFDEIMELLEVVSIKSNPQFVSFLSDLNENHSISINYPISGILDNGDLIEVNSNDELRDAIVRCQKEEFQGRCNNTLSDCAWQITEISSTDSDYEDAWFKVNRNGSVTFYYKNEAYFGTWITLYIGDDLYLNIDLNNSESIEDFWDLNWKVNLLNDETIAISNSGVQILIEKDCEIACDEGAYRVCELENNPGVAHFAFKDFTSCIGVPPTHDIVSAVQYSFHLSLEEAEMGTNPVSWNSYINTMNPQSIYVRTVYIDTQELLNIAEILIEAVPCPGG